MGFLSGLAEAIGNFVLKAIITAINLIIIAVGGLLQLLFSVLPGLPDVPENPVPEATGWVNWFIDSTIVLAFMATLVAAWIVILAWRVALKWAKAL